MTDEDFVLHGLVISLHTRLDTIERKLDWLHAAVPLGWNITTAGRSKIIAMPTWPGDLPESKP